MPRLKENDEVSYVNCDGDVIDGSISRFDNYGDSNSRVYRHGGVKINYDICVGSNRVVLRTDPNKQEKIRKIRVKVLKEKREQLEYEIANREFELSCVEDDLEKLKKGTQNAKI